MPSLTPDGFVELNRSFSNFNEDISSEHAAYDSYFSAFIDGGMNWAKVNHHRCVVILAEAGSGKTWEFKSQTQRHSDRGQFAFFVRLERLAQKPLAECLDEDETTLFEKWLGSKQKAWFFLDAVDEAKIATRNAFEEALKSFANSVPISARKRVITIVSSRIVGWKNHADTRLLRNLLDLPNKTSVTNEDGTSEDIDPLRVITLNALNNDQIKTLSSHFIPDQVEAFLQALDDHDAWSFARRPQDVERLSSYWDKVGDLGGLTDLLEFDTKSRLKETDEDRLRDSDLSDAQLRAGAEAMAAAVVFGKTLSISLEGDYGEENLTNCVLPSHELRDWSPDQRADLLSRALFDPAAFDKVRFHHRSTADYLAACWFDKLLKNGLPISDAISLFFVRSLGQEVLIPTRAAVVCWLACGDQLWNQRIRSKLLEVASDALLSQGDGGRLDIETRSDLLAGVVEKAGADGEIRADATNDQLKRLADPELSGVINKLLRDPSTSDDGSVILLRLVREGKIATCVSTCLDLARDPDTSTDVLIYTGAAIAKAGSEGEKNSFITGLLARPSLSWRVSYILVKDYYPDALTAEQLVNVANITENPRRLIAPDFTHTASQVINEVAPNSHVTVLLDGFISLLEQRPGITVDNKNTSFLISRENIWLTPILRSIVARALKLADISNITINNIIEALLFIEVAEKLERTYASRKTDLNEVSLLKPEVRRAYCWRKVECRALRTPKKNASIHDVFQNYKPLNISKDDISWLYKDLHYQNSIEHRHRALYLANSLWWYQRSWGVRYKIRNLISDSALLKSQFKSIFPGPVTLWVRRKWSQGENYFQWQLKSDLRSLKGKLLGCRNYYHGAVPDN